MLAVESTLTRKVVNLLFLGVIVAVSAVYLFRAELADAVVDSLSNNDVAAKRRWTPEVGGRFGLRAERNDAAFVQIDALRAGARSSLGVPVSFDLTNLGDANDFPNIAIVMVGAGSKPLRQILFSPRDYPHKERFEKQRVELILQPRPEELRFTVRVFYGEP
jgi:hypothetical protein